MKRHEHRFTLLYTTFGPYGRQDVHIHHCTDEDCTAVMIGDHRHCGGVKKQPHKLEVLR